MRNLGEEFDLGTGELSGITLLDEGIHGARPGLLIAMKIAKLCSKNQFHEGLMIIKQALERSFKSPAADMRAS